jgi:3-hydroxyacyl-CoA dehydrogenase
MSAIATYVLHGEIAVITIDSPPVNALSAPVRQALAENLTRAFADDLARAVVLACAGRTFHAGADITEFGRPPVSPTLREVQVLIEEAPKPVIAALHGTVLGGGLELAMVAHLRVAAPSTQLGLPEVKLGLIPGAGGTQRLPRLVGVEAALAMICDGAPITAAEAYGQGLVDALSEGADPLPAALEAARGAVREATPLRRVSSEDARLLEAAGKADLFADFRRHNARRWRGALAPEYAVRAIEVAVRRPFAEGMVEERRLFVELAAGTQSIAQRHVFFAEREARKVPDLPRDIATLPVRRVCIVGAGLMGGGIAMSCLNAGLSVTLVDATDEALARGVGLIRSHYETSARKGRLAPAEAVERLARLTAATGFEAAVGADLVIEAVFEQMDVKKEVFRRLDAVLDPRTILVTNTSYLDVDELAAVTSRGESVAGLHFFSPAHVMRLVEVVRGAHTSKEVLATLMTLAKTLGKVGVLVGNAHGFVGNRMLAPRQRAADRLILEGALPWDVDRVLVQFGFPMGPFQMRDLAGMDLGWDRARSSSATVREILNEMGRFGQKSRAGYYDYDTERRPTPSAIAEGVILEFAARQGIQRRRIEDAEILEQCLYPMVNEGARILAEGKAIRSSDIDVVWVLGYGFPAHRGGPMHWAGDEGLARILAVLERRGLAGDADCLPAPLLVELAARHGRFG